MIGIFTVLLTHSISVKQTMCTSEAENASSELHMLLKGTSSRLAKVINLLNSLKKATQVKRVPKDGNRRLCNNEAGAGLFYLN